MNLRVRWMRLARLLVACVAFFIARPAEATTTTAPSTRPTKNDEDQNESTTPDVNGVAIEVDRDVAAGARSSGR